MENSLLIKPILSLKYCFFYSIILALFLSVPSLCQEKEVELKDKRVSVRIEKQHLALVFRYLMENYDVPIGFEESVLDRDHQDYRFEPNSPAIGTKRMASSDGKVKIDIEAEKVFEAKKYFISVNVENQRLKDVLNTIVSQMENYKWEINDGVVNIFPVKGRDERFEKLLRLNIGNFTFEKGKSIKAITTNIKKLPEFQKFLAENKLYFTGIRSGVDFQINAQYGRKIDEEMHFSNLKFRDLLNKITKIKRGGWILRRKRMSIAIVEEHIDIDI
jgi:hypothetical protein